METSILNSTKKNLGVDPDYTAFDTEIITHINEVFSTLSQLGIGPPGGFAIEDAGTIWSEFLDDDVPMFNSIKTYTFLRVKLLFDPPATSFAIDALQRQIQQMEWRLNIMREDVNWTDPRLGV